MVEFKKLLLSREESLSSVVSNRILILGSNLSGAPWLRKGFQEYLEEKGVPNLNVGVLRDAGIIEKTFLGKEDLAQGRRNPEPPKGVVLLPEMRQYDCGGRGMFLNTYDCGIDTYVEELCNTYDVPLVKIQRHRRLPRQITQGLRQIIEENKF